MTTSTLLASLATPSSHDLDVWWEQQVAQLPEATPVPRGRRVRRVARDRFWDVGQARFVRADDPLTRLR